MENSNSKFLQLRIGQDDNGILEFQAVDGPSFKPKDSVPFINILKKWSKFCISYDFEKNEAQAAINGHHTLKLQNPETNPNMKGTFDANTIKDAASGTSLIITLGRYAFDNK